jgi:hypothetical protein
MKGESMRKGILSAVAVLALVLSFSGEGFCKKTKDIPQGEVLAIATEEVKQQGIDLKDVEVIYDEDGKLWVEKSGFAATEKASPNYGTLIRGFLKNYQIVYFDFKDDSLNDIWVFVDRDSRKAFTAFKDITDPEPETGDTEAK